MGQQYQAAVEYDEEWRPVPGYEGLYDVSSYGRVRSWHNTRPRILSACANDRGYLTVGLSDGEVQRTRYVHQLALEAFIGPRPDDMETRHYDGNPLNNYLDNLVYGTPKKNGEDRSRHGTAGRPRKAKCLRGHPMLDETTRPRPDGSRACLVCERIRSRRHEERTKVRSLLEVWLTGSCPMRQLGCRKNHLCQHCFENAVVDLDLEDKVFA